MQLKWAATLSRSRVSSRTLEWTTYFLVLHTLTLFSFLLLFCLSLLWTWDYGPLTTILNNCVSVMLSLFLLLYFILCLVVLSRHCKHFICCTCDIHPLCVGYARSHWRWGVAFVAVISESASMSLLQFARMSLSVLTKLDIETTFNCLMLIKKSLALKVCPRISLNPTKKNKIINFIKRQFYSMSS